MTTSHRPRDERRADRSDVVDGVRCGGDLPRHVCESVALRLYDLSVFEDRQREAGDVLAAHLRGDEVIGRICVRGGRGREQYDAQGMTRRTEGHRAC